MLTCLLNSGRKSAETKISHILYLCRNHFEVIFESVILNEKLNTTMKRHYCDESGLETTLKLHLRESGGEMVFRSVVQFQLQICVSAH